MKQSKATSFSERTVNPETKSAVSKQMEGIELHEILNSPRNGNPRRLALVPFVTFFGIRPCVQLQVEQDGREAVIDIYVQEARDLVRALEAFIREEE